MTCILWPPYLLRMRKGDVAVVHAVVELSLVISSRAGDLLPEAEHVDHIPVLGHLPGAHPVHVDTADDARFARRLHPREVAAGACAARDRRLPSYMARGCVCGYSGARTLS
jgi:hypothetical protein